jgi:hypothetical protein
LTLVNSIGQKWTKFALLPLYTSMRPPLGRAEKAPSEVQILPPFHLMKLDRNADNHQRTTANIHEYEPAPQTTGGILRNADERCSSYPPSGTIRLIACYFKAYYLD